MGKIRTVRRIASACGRFLVLKNYSFSNQTAQYFPKPCEPVFRLVLRSAKKILPLIFQQKPMQKT